MIKEAESTNYLINSIWIFNPSEGTISSPSHPNVAIRAKTCEVLLLLIINKNETVITERFLDTVWPGKIIGDSVLRQSIFELRNIFKNHSRDIILTVPKKGYRLSTQVEAITPQKPPIPTKHSISVTQSPAKPQHRTQSYLKIITGRSFFSTALMSLSIILSFIAGLYTSPILRKNNAQSAPLLSSLSISQPNITSELLAMSKNDPSQLKTLNNLLEAFHHKLDTAPETDDIKLKKFFVLSQWYNALEQYNDSLLINHNNVIWVENTFGQNNIRTILAQLYLLYSSINTGDYNRSFRLVADIDEHLPHIHDEKNWLIADFNYVQALLYLTCTYPHCDRPAAMKKGKLHAENALAQYTSLYGERSIPVADVLSLLNWFTPTLPENKVSLLAQALAIYTENLGEINTKVATTLAELSRTQTIFIKDMQAGEKNMRKALEIAKITYPENHAVVRKYLSYLGEIYLAKNELDKAIVFFKSAVANTPQNSQSSLEARILLAKSLLYTGNQNLAKHAIEKALKAAKKYEEQLPYYLSFELKTIAMRIGMIDTDLTEDQLIAADIKSYDAGQKAQNDLPAAGVSHEYLSRLLEIAPNKVDKTRYMNSLSTLLNHYKLDHRYLLASDIAFIKKRSIRLCKKRGRHFCDTIKKAFRDRHIPIGRP